MPPRGIVAGIFGSVALLAVLLGPAASGIAGQASSLVPTDDPAYRDLAALAARGIVTGQPLHQQPYSRLTFARLVAEPAAELLDERVRESLTRLQKRFMESTGGQSPHERDGNFRLNATTSRLDFIWTNSPSRPLYTNYRTTSAIDGNLNPFLRNNGGRILGEGRTIGFEGGVELGLGSHIVFDVRPRVWTMHPAQGASSSDAALQSAYARVIFGKVGVDIGRSETRLSHGVSGGPTLSTNARSMDMVRVATEEPLRLPWILSSLGPTRLQGFIADLGENRDIRGAKLIALKLSSRPNRNLEFGATLLNVQGGDGAPEASFWERFSDVFLWGVPGIRLKHISDKVAGLDFRLTLPDEGVELWLDGATTDINFVRAHEMLWDEAIWVAGLKLVGFGNGGRSDVWIEGHRSGVRPHTHHQFTSGLTLDGLVIGDPVGPMATAWSAGYDWTGRTIQLGLSGHWERYRGDQYRHNGLDAGDFRIDLASDEPDEIRLRGLVEVRYSPSGTGLWGSVKLGAESVTRFDFTGGNRTNFLTQIQINYLR